LVIILFIITGLAVGHHLVHHHWFGVLFDHDRIMPRRRLAG